MNLERLATTDIGTDGRNRVTSARELEIWATVPVIWSGYYTSDSVMTWMGDKLGTIIESRVYRHNFGGRMISMRVRGTNGAIYSGRASYDWGTCINLHKVKK
jgi:hypothetical protein